MENDNFFKKNAEIYKTISDYHVSITDELDIYNWVEDVSYYSKLTSRMSVFNNHPSIRLIKDKYQQSFAFKFDFVFTNHHPSIRLINNKYERSFAFKFDFVSTNQGGLNKNAYIEVLCTIKCLNIKV